MSIPQSKKIINHAKHFLARLFILTLQCTSAEVVKLVDTHVSEACDASRAGSSPAFGTR